tara:strand:+ start:35 stop:574 length:540 start_codon:yes stop_codon:yes gene_type:complete
LTGLYRIYWDSCAWLALIKQEEGRYEALKKVYDSAKRGHVEIWTSTFTYAEVYKKQCGEGEKIGIHKGFSEEETDGLDDILSQDFIKRIEVSQIIGVQARKLLMSTQGFSKPPDGIHLASALYWNLDVMHTFDNEDLLKLDEKLNCRDGKKFRILVPSDDIDGPLFQKRDDEKKLKKSA